MKHQEFFIPGQVFKAARHPICTIDWSPQGHSIAAGCYDGSLLVWSTSSGSLEHEQDYSDGALVSIAWSPKASHLAIASAEGSIRLLNQNAGVDGLVPTNDQKPQQLIWSPDGNARHCNGQRFCCALGHNPD